MAQIELENITHYYGDSSDAFAVSELSLVWEDGSANALLGPSGCGKTTLLNIISGLITPKSGRILFDGKDVTQLSPRNRHIAQVFQFPVVYDTMSVERNLAFPMKNAGAGKAEIRKRVGEVAELLGLSEHMKKSAVQLSDAQKQMLSLGRGIVRTDTSALLLDEPLTVIDQKIRWQLRKTLRQVQSELGITMIYVTHDQHEALTFAHNVSVMSDGVMLQTASPEKLYSEPAHPFVGHFIGSPGMNFIVVKRNGDWLETDTSEIRFPYDKCGIEVGQDQEVALGIRPEYISISSETLARWPQMTARIIEDQGSTQVLTLEDDGLRLKARAKYSDDIVEGDRFWISFNKEQVNRFDVSEISSALVAGGVD